MKTDDGHVEVEWHEPVPPRPLPEGEVTVECHLYDQNALAEAERRRTERVAASGRPSPRDDGRLLDEVTRD